MYQAASDADLLTDKIAQLPLLETRETAVCRHIDRGRHAYHKLRNNPDISSETLQRLEADVIIGQQYRNLLIVSNIRLVIKHVRRFLGTRVPQQDLIQAGFMGLLEAEKRYDLSKGFMFATYATWWINRYIDDEMAHMGRIARLPSDVYRKVNQCEWTIFKLWAKLGREPSTEEIAEAVDLNEKTVKQLLHTRKLAQEISLDEPIDLKDGPVFLSDCIPDHQSELRLDGRDVRGLLQQLRLLLDEARTHNMFGDESQTGLKQHRKWQILIWRLGLSGERRYTLEEIGKYYGVSRERIRQIERKASQVLEESPAFRDRYITLMKKLQPYLTG